MPGFFEVNDSDGALVYDSDSVTWNQIGYFFVGSNSSYTSIPFPFVENRETLVTQILVNSPPTTRRAIAHTVTWNPDFSVSVSGGSEDSYVLVLYR